MKRSFVVVGALLFAFTQVAEAAIAGRFQFVNGDVKVIAANGKERSASKGSEVSEGESVVTSTSASAQIKMVDDGLIVVRPDTKLRITTFLYSGKTDGSERSFISLFKGGFRAITGAIGRVNKDNYKIETPTATIGIRGTDHEPTFIPNPAPGQVAIAEPGTYDKVNSGAAVLSNANGTVIIKPDQAGFVPNIGNATPKILATIPAFLKTAPSKDEPKVVPQAGAVLKESVGANNNQPNSAKDGGTILQPVGAKGSPTPLATGGAGATLGTARTLGGVGVISPSTTLRSGSLTGGGVATSIATTPTTTTTISPTISTSRSLTTGINTPVLTTTTPRVLSPTLTTITSPTVSPTIAPSVAPTGIRVLSPTIAPAPVVAPTVSPTIAPTVSPTVAPVIAPTTIRVLSPTVTNIVAPAPVVAPTVSPTIAPTVSPTVAPVIAPTTIRVLPPTVTNIVAPAPVVAPTVSPTITPVVSPTVAPTITPTVAPVVAPTVVSPAPAPTVSPTVTPVIAPTTTIQRLNVQPITTFSDRRLKTNIKRIGTHRLGIGIYEFDYVWGEHATGVMADEVKTVMPEAVTLHPSGYDMVDYSKLQ